jgi:hypothetical protein
MSTLLTRRFFVGVEGLDHQHRADDLFGHGRVGRVDMGAAI